MNLLSRKKLLGGLMGLFAAGALLAPVAAARVAATVTVVVPDTPQATEPDLFDVLRCKVPVDIDWDATAIPGPSVTVQLDVSADGGVTWSPNGTRVRAEDTGGLHFEKLVYPGNYTYRASLSKGPKHVIASGTSNSVDCLPVATD